MALYKPDSPTHPYTTDILGHMKLQESRFSKRYFRRSPQLDCRRFLVDWLCLVAEKTRLKRATVHLAIKLLDFFMDAHSVEINKIYLVSIACLTLSAKFEEKDSKVPGLDKLMACVPIDLQLDYRHKDHVQIEGMVLAFFDWNVFIPTASSYVELLLPYAVIDTDSYQDEPVCNSIDSVRSNFMNFVKYFLDISLQDAKVVQVIPSILAASVLYSSRLAFGIVPSWPLRLEQITGFEYSDFVDCSAILMSTFARASGDTNIMLNVLPTSESEKRKKRTRRAGDANTQTRRKRSKPDETKPFCSKVNGQSKAKKKPASTEITPKTPDEGYGSFNVGFSGSFLQQQSSGGESEPRQRKSTLDILLQASDTIEETEIKHENFKEEIMREISETVQGTDSCSVLNGTNIEGTDVRHGDVFLYTVVKDEKM